MNLDRAYQLEILKRLAETYPLSYDYREYYRSLTDDERFKFGATLTYLDGHGLIRSGLIPGHVDSFSRMPIITERGLDFLADDGGLTAMLGVVTIKLHDETIKELIAMKISDSHLAPADKKKWLDALRSLPADATKHLTMKLLDLGLAHAPDAVHAIGTFLGS